jgi:hypothetical protein
MARISTEQHDALRQAIQAHDFLAALAREIEQQQRLVFHALNDADWSLARGSAEQILMSEVVLRHQGKVEGVFAALEDLQRRGREWPAAIRELASRIQSYYTTPLGIRLRADLFGDQAIFIARERASGMSSAVTARSAVGPKGAGERGGGEPAEPRVGRKQ